MSYINILQGDCRALLKTIPDESIDSIVTDPPYELGFMGKRWDSSGIAYDLAVWRECLRVLKPGGHLLAFGGTRTYHRMTCAIEDAGFEIRDCIMWVYGSGFPKSHDVSKAIDKAAGAEREIVGESSYNARRPNSPKSERYAQAGHQALITAPATEAARQWQGWGSALKPAVEPIVCARKPLIGTIVENVLAHGTGAINVDGCRIGWQSNADAAAAAAAVRFANSRKKGTTKQSVSIGKESRDGENTYFPEQISGRWPANLIHDGSPEVVELFPDVKSGGGNKATKNAETFLGTGFGGSDNSIWTANGGSAARFFYCAKTSPSERGDNGHPTVKPIALMRYLCRLVTPPSGVVLDPFAGSGTTLVAARLEGFSAIGCELQQEHVDIIKRRLDLPAEAYAEEQREEEQPKPVKREQLKLF